MKLIFFFLLSLAHNDLWLILHDSSKNEQVLSCIVQVRLVKSCSKYIICLLVHPTGPAFSYPQPPSI